MHSARASAARRAGHVSVERELLGGEALAEHRVGGLVGGAQLVERGRQRPRLPERRVHRAPDLKLVVRACARTTHEHDFN